MVIRLIFSFAVCCACVAPGRAQIGGVDTMRSAEWVSNLQPEVLASWSKSGAWIRLAALPDPGSQDPQQLERVAREVAALRALAKTEIRILGRIRWSSNSWRHGVRSGGGKRVPIDLREAYERARRYAETYGEWVDAFEFENEPDIAFVQDNAETYAAYFKACYLGVRAGAKHPTVWRRWAGGVSRVLGLPMRDVKPWVAMAPLALPPGPYFERVVENGLLSYTDVFNFHYYGFADDFSGVYRQLQDAVFGNAENLKTKTLKWREGEAGNRGQKPKVRKLPVLLSEYGYGSLGETSSKEVEGRVRQWAWFREVTEQIYKAKIEGSMAFTLKPGLERNKYEFGIAATAAENREAETQEAASLKPETLKAEGVGVEFSEEDFGASRSGPWVTRIGRKVGGYEAMPALAWLMDFGERHRYRPRDWRVVAERRSNVVVDFVAGAGLTQLKRYHGYIAADPSNEARGEIVLYNFGDRTVRGEVRFEGGVAWLVDGATKTECELDPGMRLVLPVRLKVPAAAFVKAEWRVSFVASESRGGTARFSTACWPNMEGMTETVVERLAGSGGAAIRNREILRSRRLAREEEELVPNGRWLVSPGVAVEEREGGLLRFVVPARDDDARARTVAELPLRDDFVFPENALLRLSYRLAQPAGVNETDGRNLQVYFRTENGNLFVVWPPVRAHAAWSHYVEAKGNFTAAFYGRAELPWQFGENRVTALVFAFATEKTPLVFEVHDPRIVEIGR